MVTTGRTRTAKPVGAVLKRAPLVLIGCCVVFGATTPASAAVSGSKSASEAPVSGRYQAILCDIATPGGFGSIAAGVDSAPGTASHGFRALDASFRSRASVPAIARYQPRNVISNSHWTVSSQIPATIIRSVDGTCIRNAFEISSVTSKETAPSARTDARRLFQLAVALAAAYVLFLVAWFWATRQHRGRVGSAARS